jgi:hypothetical protein
MAKKTITELTNFYFDKLGMKEAHINWKKKIFKDIEDTARKGFSLNEIEKAISRDAENFRSLLKASKNDNLIQENQFYYHPHLQVAPSAPIIHQNDDGTFMEVKEDFYLKLREVFTVDDAVEYFYSKFPNVSRNKKRDTGGVMYLYSKILEPTIASIGADGMNALDLLLFAIDTALYIAYDGDKRVAMLLNLQDYVDEAMYIYEEKINYAKLNGLDKVQ